MLSALPRRYAAPPLRTIPDKLSKVKKGNERCLELHKSKILNKFVKPGLKTYIRPNSLLMKQESPVFSTRRHKTDRLGKKL